ncbi:hypothetical protein B0H17DRAFT_657154 [Mycena rosella]|uniref:Uncharacterized protein n=1 Tax=Mycena rosella TaxID=1033263 RepID=A0AAD7GCS9_MYCRO|nr:hypothetical protein B0H17DRAFT_657154 [Mycena rosella]
MNDPKIFACGVAGIAGVYALVKALSGPKVFSTPRERRLTKPRASWFYPDRRVAGDAFIVPRGVSVPVQRQRVDSGGVREISADDVQGARRRPVERHDSGARAHGGGRQRAGERALFYQSINEFLQTGYTMGWGIEKNPYHAGVVRTSMTRNLGTLFPEVRDEIVAAFDDLLACTSVCPSRFISPD